MKKVSVFLLSLIGFAAFSQQNKVVFNKNLDYKLYQSAPSRGLLVNENPRVSMYTNNAESLILFSEKNAGNGNLFVDQNGVSNIHLGINNTLEANFNNTTVFAGIYAADADRSEQKLSLIPLNTKETILGLSCDQYLLKAIFVDPSMKNESDDLKICVNTTSKINNVPIISQVFKSQYGVDSVVKLDGLLLKAGSSKNYDKDYLILENIADTKDFVVFNNKANLEKQNQFIEEAKIKVAENLKTKDSTSVSLDSVDIYSINRYQDEVDLMDHYNSTYRKPTEGDVVIGSISEDSKIWNILPKHCRNIDKDIAAFEDPILKKRLKNYIGQICDLYLLEFEYNNVGPRETTDELRRESLYLFNSLETLNKKDKKKLKEYLNKLD